MNKTLRILGYVGFGLLLFVFFLFVTFPYDVLKTKIIGEIENSLGGTYHIKVASMSAGFIMGIGFKNVEVYKRDGDKELLLLKTPKLKVRPSLIALLRKKTDLSFSVVVGKGEVSGSFADDSDGTQVSLDFDELNLADLKFLPDLYQLNLAGVLNGGLEFELSKKEISRNQGSVDLDFENLILTSYKIILDPQVPESAMEIPKITLTGPKNSKITASVVKGELEIKEIVLKGGDLDLSLKGKIGFAPRLEDYRVNVEGRLKVNEALEKSVPFFALLEQQKEADGSFILRLEGKLGKPAVTLGRFQFPTGS